MPSSAAIRYHSLFALRGKALRRYREFVVFHPYVMPAYLIAYQRKLGGGDAADEAGEPPAVVVKDFGDKYEVMMSRCQLTGKSALKPGVFTAADVGSAIRIRGDESALLWRAGELRVDGAPRTVYWGALVRPEDVDDATITEVDQQSFGTVALSNGVTFQNPPAPPQPLPARFRQTADGRWKIRNRDEVRRIRLGDSGAEGRLSRLK